MHTQVDPTRQGGEFMHHLVLTVLGLSIPWHTPTPLSKSLDKFRCVFICFAGLCTAASDRQTWISLGRGLVGSVMDRLAVPRGEMASSFREQEGRTSNSSITLTLTFCGLAGGGDEESRPRISSATFLPTPLFLSLPTKGAHA